MNTSQFNRLTNRERALICIAVLLDGFEAGTFLSSDIVKGEAYDNVANDFANLNPELRMPLLGTLLRMASKEM